MVNYTVLSLPIHKDNKVKPKVLKFALRPDKPLNTCKCSLFDAAQPVETAQSAGKLTFPVPTLTGRPHKAAWSNPVRQDTAKRRGATRKAEGQSMASGVDRMSRAVWHPRHIGIGQGTDPRFFENRPSRRTSCLAKPLRRASWRGGAPAPPQGGAYGARTQAAPWRGSIFLVLDRFKERRWFSRIGSRRRRADFQGRG